MNSYRRCGASAVLAVAVMLACQAFAFASYPAIVTYPTVNSSVLIANDSNKYSVTVTVSDPSGYSDIVDVRVLFNFTESGGVQTYGRGYLAWGAADSNITRYGGSWVLATAAGSGGRWGYPTDLWGGTTYFTPTACNMSVIGSASGGTGSRSISWQFKVKPAWARNPLINDTDIWVQDASGVGTGWKDGPNEFDVVASSCLNTAVTPRAPVVSNATATSLDVAISPLDSATDLYCIKISPAILGKQYVQADGSVGGYAVLQSRAAWGTKTVTGLPTSTSFSFSARAIGPNSGDCASAWGLTSPGATVSATRVIDCTVTGKAMAKGIAGNNSLAWNQDTGREADILASCYNTSIRFGGDGYYWKACTAQWDSSSKTTLQVLREARDRNSYVQILTNTRGIGTGNGSTWVYTDQTPETLASLTADWVYYCNVLLQTKRQGDTLTPQEQALLDSLSWGANEKLLQPGEAPVPKVTYWEIGNEPEGPYPPPALTPADYANRYNIISHAVLAADPTVKVGPGMMSADNGNAWLDAVLSNPANQVDFVNYHPYGPLYGIVKNDGGVLNADDINAGLNTIRQQQTDRRQKVIDRLAANGRPTSTSLVTSEYNPSSWEGTYYYTLNRTQAHALGLVDTIFTFADLGFLASQYWDAPNNPHGSKGIEAPGFKAMKMIQAYTGDRLLNTYTEPDFRMYSTLDSLTGRVVVWVINYSEYADKSVRLQIPSPGVGLTMQSCRLAALVAGTSLITTNLATDTSDKIQWQMSDLTGSVDPADFTLNFPHATLTMLRIERPFMSVPDGTRVSVSGGATTVTAAYPAENYLYVEKDSRTYGLRVEGAFSGIGVGDRVVIGGIMSARKPDGTTRSERCISADSIERAGSGSPIKPVGVNCSAVGGGANAFTAGVRDGAGLSNIGLLVRIAGRVTSVEDAERMYVDDGANVQDVLGKTGVLIRCPDTSSYRQGDFVAVTGVIEGDVPTGWSANRRLIRARTVDDVTDLLK